MELYTLQQHNESITYYFQFSLNQPCFSTWDLHTGGFFLAQLTPKADKQSPKNVLQSTHAPVPCDHRFAWLQLCEC